MKRISFLALFTFMILSATSTNLYAIGRDPTKPPSAKAESDEEVDASSTLSLAGVIHAGDSPSAIINGMVYRVGDTVQDMTIKKITPYGVVFVGAHGEFELAVRASTYSNIYISKTQE